MNFMTLENIKGHLLDKNTNDSEQYSNEEIIRFLQKLKLVEQVDKMKLIDEEDGVEYFVKDILDVDTDFSEREYLMIIDILLSDLSKGKYYLINDEFEKIIKILYIRNYQIDFFKKVIQEMYEIENPNFTDYEDFIQCSFRIIKYLSMIQLNSLKREFINLEEKVDTSFYTGLMSRLIYGMRYAGEPGEHGKAYHGMEKIKVNSINISESSLIEILNYINYENHYIINENPKSIKEMIRSVVYKHDKDNNTDDLMKYYYYFYIDSHWIWEYISEISFNYISQMEEYQKYIYMINDKDKRIQEKDNGLVIRELMHKHDDNNINNLIVSEIKDFKNKIIKYTVVRKTKDVIKQENESKENEYELIDIIFRYFEDNNSIICDIELPEQKEKSLEVEIEYDFEKTNYLVFGQVLDKKNKKKYNSIYEFMDQIKKLINVSGVKQEIVEIQYLYVNNMYGDPQKKYILNFTDEYKFELKQNNEKIIVSKNEANTLSDDFFSIDDKYDNNILNIYALLGQNGSGKTSIINLIRMSELFGGEEKNYNEANYCLMYKVASNLYYISNIKNIEIESVDNKFKITKGEISDEYRNTSVIFFSNIVNLNCKKDILLINEHNIEANGQEKNKQIDLSSQNIYNSKSLSNYNDEVLKLIEFSKKYYSEYMNMLLYSNGVTEIKNEDKNKSEEQYQFKVKVLDYVYIEFKEENIILEMKKKVKNKKLNNCYLYQIERDNILNCLQEKFFNQHMNKEYEIIRDILLQYYEDKKCMLGLDDKDKSKSIFSNNDSIWKIIEIIIDKGICVKDNELKYKIIINFIIKYYCYKEYIDMNENNDYNEDIIWELIDEINQEEVLNEHNYLRINILDGMNLISKINKIIQELNQIGLNFIHFQVPNISSGEMARLNLFSRLDNLWCQKDIMNRNNNKNYILLLDEAEAFFHPEWQRTFIYDLIYFLEFKKKHNNAFNSIQIIISSNSPFLISDLPSKNLIFLEEKKRDAISGFGQNIHSLLNDTFFMTSTIGEFAKIKINEIIKTLNKESVQYLRDNKDDIEKRIKIIGEPLIRNKLLDMLFKKLYTYEEKDLEIKHIEDKIKELQLIRKELKNNNKEDD